MDRKLNLAKIAGKSSKIPRLVNSPVKNTVTGQSVTESPYFSPIAGRTRNKDAAKSVGVALKSNNTKPSSTSESVSKIEKKFAVGARKTSPREHIKVEYDENRKSSIENKKEIKEEIIDDEYEKTTAASIKIKGEDIDDDKKPVKQTKKRSSGGINTAGSSTDVKVEKNIKTEGNDDSPSSEKQTKWEPTNWRQLLANIREMRKERNAPVDTMGCEKCHDPHSDEKTRRFHHLISLMLSSQTKDAVTFDAMGRLKSHGLTPDKMVEISIPDLEQLLYPVGFYKTKAKNIQKTAQVLIEKFDSDIPNDLKGLLSLPGVGPKMAHICMRVAWNVITGIGVDTHVHRIANRLKWVPKETKDPEKTRIALEKWLPFEEWVEVNELLVGFGQTICAPTNPRCSECLNAMICPASSVKKKRT